MYICVCIYIYKHICPILHIYVCIYIYIYIFKIYPYICVASYCDRLELTYARQHTSADVSIRQHTSADVSIRQQTSAYVSIRQHTSAYLPYICVVASYSVGIRLLTYADVC